MVRTEEWLSWVLLQSLGTVPGQVLKGEQRSVGGEDVIEVSGADDDVVRTLNNVLQRAVQSRAGRLVALADEDVDVGALGPVGADGGVDGGLDVGAVEVDLEARRLVVARVYDAEDGVGVRAGLGDVVDVEARVDLERGLVDVVPQVASRGRLVQVRVRQRGEGLLRRGEGQVGLQVGGVVALLGAVLDDLGEGLVEEEQVGPEVDVLGDDDWFVR